MILFEVDEALLSAHHWRTQVSMAHYEKAVQFIRLTNSMPEYPRANPILTQCSFSHGSISLVLAHV